MNEPIVFKRLDQDTECRGERTHRQVRLRLCAALLLSILGWAGIWTPSNAGAQREERSAAARERPVEGVVNIKTATVGELTRLPGVGPSKASAIVQYRERRPFERVRDILRVRGIGRKTFRELKHYLVVEGPTTLGAPINAQNGTIAK